MTIPEFAPVLQALVAALGAIGAAIAWMFSQTSRSLRLSRLSKEFDNTRALVANLKDAAANGDDLLSPGLRKALKDALERAVSAEEFAARRYLDIALKPVRASILPIVLSIVSFVLVSLASVMLVWRPFADGVQPWEWGAYLVLAVVGLVMLVVSFILDQRPIKPVSAAAEQK